MMRTRFAALNFKGAAATWLQTMKRRDRITDWDRLCELVFAKFDKDQYQTQLKQLESLKQLGSVADYQDQFEKLAHGILLYNLGYDDVYFVTRFLAGLKEEIRAPIALHRLKDVDTASALTLLQEEELSLAKYRTPGQAFTRGAERSSTSKTTDKTISMDTEDKLTSLKQYRRKNGLCFKCGGKWNVNHTCSDTIPLHVLEELLDALNLPESLNSEEIQSEITPEDDSVMTVQSLNPSGKS